MEVVRKGGRDEGELTCGEEARVPEEEDNPERVRDAGGGLPGVKANNQGKSIGGKSRARCGTPHGGQHSTASLR